MLAKKTFILSKSAVCLSVLGLGLLLISSGCSTMFLNPSATPMATETPVDSAGSYYVEMHTSFGKPTVFKGELTGPMTVQFFILFDRNQIVSRLNKRKEGVSWIYTMEGLYSLVQTRYVLIFKLESYQV